jgi:hypothetical protein
MLYAEHKYLSGVPMLFLMIFLEATKKNTTHLLPCKLLQTCVPEDLTSNETWPDGRPEQDASEECVVRLVILSFQHSVPLTQDVGIGTPTCNC